MAIDCAQLREMARRYTAAWCSQNAASVANFYAENGLLCINGGVPATGRTSIGESVQSFMSAFPDLQVQMDDFKLDGDRAIYKWTLAGTNTGPGGFGHRVRISGYEEWKINPDGLIAESEGHFDAAEYQRQLETGYKNFTEA
jgi:uncharacterized protein (TIGR02246 family)